jgi:uncharacterized membrane protein YfcA
MFNVEWVAAYVALGAAAGFLGGLFGIGGGFVLVPVLLMLYDAQHFPSETQMHLALGTAMAVIVFTSLSSTYKHHQHQGVIWRVVRDITPGILVGTAMGALLASAISSRVLGIVFALFVLLAATQILLDLQPKAVRALPGRAGMTLAGTFTGWLSSVVAIGGGTIVVPFLVWCNTPLRLAIGTSAAIGFPIALGGTLGYIATGWGVQALPGYTLGYVYLPALLWAASASIMTAPVGAKFAHSMNIHLLRRLFALVLLALAIKLLLKVL